MPTGSLLDAFRGGCSGKQGLCARTFHEGRAAGLQPSSVAGARGGGAAEARARPNVEITGAARLYRAASVWTAGLGTLLVRTTFLAFEQSLTVECFQDGIKLSCRLYFHHLVTPSTTQII